MVTRTACKAALACEHRVRIPGTPPDQHDACGRMTEGWQMSMSWSLCGPEDDPHSSFPRRNRLQVKQIYKRNRINWVAAVFVPYCTGEVAEWLKAAPR